MTASKGWNPRWHTAVFSCMALSLLAGPTLADAPPAEPCGDVLLWISVDGIAIDDLDTATTPFIDQLRANGMHSDQLWPPYPSLTFSSHATQATGQPAAGHGITGNVVHDRRDGRTRAFPRTESWLLAEAIWRTAERQGVRSLVRDWPMSHRPDQAAAAPAFVRGIPDRGRLEALVSDWTAAPAPARLLMAYVSGPDAAGHRAGPGSPPVRAALERTDLALSAAHDTLRRAIDRRCGEGSSLWLMLSSDHGMMPARTLVNPWRLAFPDPASALARESIIVASGPVAHLFLPDRLAPEHRQRLARQLRHAMTRMDGTRLLHAPALDAIGGGHPRRSGDFVMLLPPGHAFSQRVPELSMPAADAGLRGMHGHDPARVPAMRSLLVLHRDPPLPPALRDHGLGRVDAAQLHATAAQLLGIRPSDSAQAGIFVKGPPPHADEWCIEADERGDAEPTKSSRSRIVKGLLSSFSHGRESSSPPARSQLRADARQRCPASRTTGATGPQPSQRRPEVGLDAEP